MSRLWPDEIGVYLAPRRLCSVRVHPGLRPSLVREKEIAWSAPASGGWEPALQALIGLLKEADWSGAHVRAVVADHWVRYVVVPYTPALDSAAERDAHARGLLAGMYGDAVSDWRVCQSQEPPGTSRIASAMPAGLLDGLKEACTGAAVRLISVQPQLITSFNAWRHRLPGVGAWFVTIEEGSMAAVRIAPSGFDRVRSVRIGTDWARELRRLQTFGRLASASSADGRVYVDAPSTWRPAGIESGPELEWLQDEEETTRFSTLGRLEHLRRLAA